MQEDTRMRKFLPIVMLFMFATSALGQDKDSAVIKVPVATQWLLDAAGPTQRSAIKSVLLLICQPDGAKGTGFLLKNGLVITAAHVVGTCSAAQVVGLTSMGRSVQFSRLAKDLGKDLAALKPSTAMAGELQLAPDAQPALET